MGGCQNYGLFFGYPKNSVPYCNRDPQRDHNFDNHPYIVFVFKFWGLGLGGTMKAAHSS